MRSRPPKPPKRANGLLKPNSRCYRAIHGSASAAKAVLRARARALAKRRVSPFYRRSRSVCRCVALGTAVAVFVVAVRGRAEVLKKPRSTYRAVTTDNRVAAIESGSPRVVECAELIAADLFTRAEQTRARLTFGDVERYLAQLASHPPDCTCGRCGLAPRVTAQRVYAIASGWQRQVRATRARAPR